VCPSGLDHVVELPGFPFEGAPELLEGGDQVPLDRDEGRQVDGRGDDVVGGLAHVDVVVRVDGALRADLTAEKLDRPVRDDLVGVHVGRGPGASLEYIQDEGVIEGALNDLLGSLHDGVLELLVEEAQLVVHDRGFELYGSQSLDKAARLAQVAYGEVFEGASRLGAEKGVARDLDLPHRVALYPVRGLVLSHTFSSSRSSNIQIILCSKRSPTFTPSTKPYRQRLSTSACNILPPGGRRQTRAASRSMVMPLVVQARGSSVLAQVRQKRSEKPIRTMRSARINRCAGVARCERKKLHGRK
jgi:hypothetical protein